MMSYEAIPYNLRTRRQGARKEDPNWVQNQDTHGFKVEPRLFQRYRKEYRDTGNVPYALLEEIENLAGFLRAECKRGASRTRSKPAASDMIDLSGPFSKTMRQVRDEKREIRAQENSAPEILTQENPQREFPQEPFNAEFLSFLATGDVSELAPTGTMTPEVFLATRPYVFCSIVNVFGKTVQGAYMSGKQFTGILAPGVTVNRKDRCVIIHEGGLIKGAIQLDERFRDLGNVFNAVASAAKKQHGIR
jgi:hypothetical protein